MVIWLVFSKHYSTGLRNYKKNCKSLPIFGRMPTVDNIYTKYTRVVVIILLVLVHCVFVLILSGARPWAYFCSVLKHARSHVRGMQSVNNSLFFHCAFHRNVTRSYKDVAYI